MKRVLHGLLMALSTYSIIPVPVMSVWDDGARSVMTLFLPVVGLIIGLIWLGLASLFELIGLPALILAAVLTVYPHIASGFFHLDGYMDCADAVLSRRSLSERQRILKDSHVGSFAVIALSFLLLAVFACWAELPAGASLSALALIPVCSRSVAAIAVTVLRPLSTSQYSGAYREGVKKGDAAVLSAELAAALLVSALFGLTCLIPCAVCAAVSAIAVFFNRRSLGGMSGDIAGCSITTGEAAAAAALVITALLS